MIALRPLGANVTRGLFVIGILGAAHCASSGDAQSPAPSSSLPPVTSDSGTDAPASATPDASTSHDASDASSAPDVEAGISPSSVLYASPDGTGVDCTLAAPCSLTGARDKARAMRAQADQDVTIQLRGGTYFLTSAFELGPGDSGSQAHPVVYEAYPSEHPILSGGAKVTGLTQSAQPGVWNAHLAAGSRPRQIYVNDVRAARAQSARGALSFTAVANGLASTTAPSPLANWTFRPGLEVTDDNSWKHMRCPIIGIAQTPSPAPPSLGGGAAAAAGGVTLVVDPACWGNNQLHVPNLGYPYNGSGLPALSSVTTLESALELLDASGEFYVDSATGLLSYSPRPGEVSASAEIVTPAIPSLVVLAGTPGHVASVNQDDSAAIYSGSWSTANARGFGDLNDDVAFATAGDATVVFAFHGTGIDVLGETNSDQGGVDVTVVDAATLAVVAQTTVPTTSPERLAQQAIYSVSGLPLADYRITLRKHDADGKYIVIDGFIVLPEPIATVHDIAFHGIAFEHTAWSLPDTDGYIDNQAGILWSATTHAPLRMPGAIRVVRGERIDISGNELRHLGAAAIELADGTHDTSVVGNRFDDISGGAIFVGEVDDVYLNDTMPSGPARMTSGNIVSNNAITRSGVDFHDTVAIWVGNARSTTISHNVVAHVPYTGISVGWGWGWASSCSAQSTAGVSPCRHGTSYSGANHVDSNRVYDVMRTLYDGGPIYTLGGQSVINGVSPTVQGNVLSTPAQCAHMIYHDEGSSYWQTNENILFDTQCHWIGMWIQTINHIQAGQVGANYTDNPQAGLDNGTGDVIVPPTLLSLATWPAAALAIDAAAGLEPVYAALFDEGKTLEDSDPRIHYSSDANAPQWAASLFRGFGDSADDVHYATADGATVALTFTGTGVALIAEKEDDPSASLVITLDGATKGAFAGTVPPGSPRLVRQTIYEVHGLTAGQHVITAKKRGGAFATIDAFVLD